VLLRKDNPYRGGLPNVINLSPDDFIFKISPMNLNAIDEVAKWTVLVYMAADCDLAEPMFDNLLQMKTIGSNKDINICVFFDGPLLTDSFFARLNRNTTIEEDIIFRFLDVNSNDSKVLQETIASNMAIYPSERKLLILSGHGFGWQGALRDDSTWKNYKKHENIVLPQRGIESCAKQLIDCYNITIAEIRKRLSSEATYKGFKFDVVAMDACNMGNLETLDHFIGLSNILIASEIPEPGGGYPYDKILSKLKINPFLDHNELSKHIVNETNEYYAHSHQDSNVAFIAQSAFDCHKFPDLIKNITDLAKEMTFHINQHGIEKIKNCIQDTYRIEKDYIDIKSLSLNLSETDLPDGVKKASETLIDFFNHSGLILEGRVPGGRYMPNGLSIYAPPPEEFNMKYVEIINSLSSGLMPWCCFLGAYYNGILGRDAVNNPLVRSIQETMSNMI
jgi:hypothetical protein